MSLSNIDIAQAAHMLPIATVAERLGIPEESLEPYGRYKAKISLEYLASIRNGPRGKLVLVTAVSPTPAGEGKTTTTVGRPATAVGSSASVRCAWPCQCRTQAVECTIFGRDRIGSGGA